MARRKALSIAAVLIPVLAGGSSLAASVPAPPDVAASPEDAQRTASGLAHRLLSAGHGDTRPGAADWVIIRYSSWTPDGEVFDSSVARNQALRTPLGRLVPGLREGLGLMVEGEKRRLWIPGELAYAGQKGKPQGMLVFDIELTKVVPFPEAPVDVGRPPIDAEILKSGLASKVLRQGSGTRRPRPRDRVVVHYTGWTTDGEMFDSSVLKGQPARFPLDQVIRGWTEGLGLMVEGEKRRLWIPQKLAYRGAAGKPRGMLVFDVELLEIE